MDIRNIRAFVRVAELKSFSKAAAELDYVQSTVTMQVRQLEQELGYPLFDRIGKRVSLTAMGAEFLTCSFRKEQGFQLRPIVCQSLFFSLSCCQKLFSHCFHIREK